MGNNKKINPWRALGLAGTIGIELSVLLLLGIWLGNKLDQSLNTSPIFLIIGMILGLFIGIWSIVKMIKPFLGD